MKRESLQIPTDPPLKGTSTIGSRGGGPPENSCGNPSVVQVKQMKSVEEDRELVTELRFRAQFIHLGLSERSSVESTSRANESNQDSRTGPNSIQRMDSRPERIGIHPSDDSAL